jgi:multidrug resistance efflux pump
MLTEEEKRQAENIEIRSQEMQDLLGKIPNRIIRWGITVVLLVIIILLFGSWLFKYPQIHPSPIVLTTENPPVTLVARINGKLQKLFVTDNEKVQKGEFLALIETAADYQQVEALKIKLDSLDINSDKNEFHVFDQKYTLGELQSSYSNFLKLYRDYENFIKLDYHAKKIKSLRAEILQHNIFISRLAKESSVLKREYQLIQKQYARDSIMHHQGVIASSDFEKSESNKLEKEYNYNETRTSLANAKIGIAELNQKILDMELQYSTERNDKFFQLNEAYQKLVADIDLWEQQHILKTPIDGTVSFNRFWSENQNVKEGEEVLTIIPENPGKIIGKINLSIKGAGKVKTGQRVNIKFENYPYMEFGMVQGVITSISLVPNQNYYSAEVTFPSGMMTNYGNKIEFKQNMPGTAEIITENMSILRKITYPVKSVFKEQKSY